MGQYVQAVVFDRERMLRQIASGDAAAKLKEPTDDYARYQTSRACVLHSLSC